MIRLHSGLRQCCLQMMIILSILVVNRFARLTTDSIIPTSRFPSMLLSSTECQLDLIEQHLSSSPFDDDSSSIARRLLRSCRTSPTAQPSAVKPSADYQWLAIDSCSLPSASGTTTADNGASNPSTTAASVVLTTKYPSQNTTLLPYFDLHLRMLSGISF